MTSILDLPDEILEPILALVTEPVRAEYTPEPDGGEYPNGETQFQIELLQFVCKRFNRIALKGHFRHHEHRVAVATEKEPVDDLVITRAALARSHCTFVENDPFFCRNTQRIQFLLLVAGVRDLKLVMRKVGHILRECETVTTVTLDTGLIDAHVKAAACGAMHILVEEEEQRLGWAVRLEFQGL